jgi:hypothetical protein
LASESPIAEVISIGTSVRGQPLWTLRITGSAAAKPGVLYHGAQHGNEIGGTATIMRLAEYLVSGYGVLPEVTQVLNNVEFYLLPIMNPDTYPYDRYNVHGVDLNRNWDGPTGQTNSGPWPFSEPETAAIRDFLAGHPNIRAHVDLHTSGHHIMWPWGHTKGYCLDHHTFAMLGARMQQSIMAAGGREYVTGPVHSAIYPVLGGSVDYSYGIEHIWAFAFELDWDCNEALPALLDLANWIGDCNANGVPDADDIAAHESADCNANSVPDECEYRGDCDADGYFDICELYAAGDCNSNGVPDTCDAEGGNDCNNNSVPDECEANCNGNNTPDDCDIALGSSVDCDENGVPDECQADCDADGVADACEIGAGAADCNTNRIPDACEDCDGNGLADSCDLAGGTAYDGNGNGVLDICETVWFVDDDANPGGDGRSWANAFHDLQNALSVAEPGDAIRVASGIYTPDAGTGDRNATFQLIGRVELRGGYAGLGHPEPDLRDATRFVTQLSGDLARDEPGIISDCCVPHETPGCSDSSCQDYVCRYSPECCTTEWSLTCVFSMPCFGLCGSRSDNSLHVVTASGAKEPAVLDGFTLRGGNANGETDQNAVGGGILNIGGNLILRNCTITQNHAYYGGGLWNQGCDALVENCLFEHNTCGVYGGAVENDASNVSFSRCLFRANYSGNLAGAVSNQDSSARFDHCFFSANQARMGGALRNRRSNVNITSSTFNNNAAIYHFSGGGAVLSDYGGDVTIVDSLFAGNSADDDGGAVYNNYATEAAYIGCTFVANSAGRNGGALANLDNSPQITNCVLWDNRDMSANAENSQIAFRDNDGVYATQIAYSAIQGWSGAWGGVGNSGADPLFLDSLGSDGEPGTGDENYRLALNSPAINAGVVSVYTPETDLDDHPRVLCGAIDLGAYEFGIGDFNCDRYVDALDFSGWALCMSGPSLGRSTGCQTLDFDADHAVDLRDFAAFQRALGTDH